MGLKTGSACVKVDPEISLDWMEGDDNVVGGQRENMPGMFGKVLRSGKAGRPTDCPMYRFHIRNTQASPPNHPNLII